MKPNIKYLTDGMPSLGSYAEVIAQIEAVLNDAHSNLANLAEVIERDPDLAARLLKLGNSAFFWLFPPAGNHFGSH